MYRNVFLLLALFALVSAQLQSNTTNTTTTQLPTTNNQTTTTPTTTLAPSTTTTPAPTPTPVPTPTQFTGNVTKDNKTCISVQFGVQIKIKYNNTDKPITESSTEFNIPADAIVDEVNSHCASNDSQPEPEVIVIRFANNHTAANLTLIFDRKDNAFVEEINLSFVLTKDLFPNIESKYIGQTAIVSQKNLTLFSAPVKRSYTCAGPQSADLNGTTTPLKNVQIDFTSSQVEAYIPSTNAGKFDSSIDCKSNEISDVVPIAVGAALAGLVVIVLIAYFIGRRRSRRLAYQSV